jgi:hypothetical protein
LWRRHPPSSAPSRPSPLRSTSPGACSPRATRPRPRPLRPAALSPSTRCPPPPISPPLWPPPRPLRPPPPRAPTRPFTGAGRRRPVPPVRLPGLRSPPSHAGPHAAPPADPCAKAPASWNPVNAGWVHGPAGVRSVLGLPQTHPHGCRRLPPRPRPVPVIRSAQPHSLHRFHRPSGSRRLIPPPSFDALSSRTPIGPVPNAQDLPTDAPGDRRKSLERFFPPFRAVLHSHCSPRATRPFLWCFLRRLFSPLCAPSCTYSPSPALSLLSLPRPSLGVVGSLRQRSRAQVRCPRLRPRIP